MTYRLPPFGPSVEALSPDRAVSLRQRRARSVAAARQRPGRVGGADDCPFDAIARQVAAAFALPPGALTTRGRGPATAAFARQVAMYLAHVEFGASHSAVGRAFGRDRTTAAHGCRVVEERRDDPQVDALLERLARALAPIGGRGAGCGRMTRGGCP
ncbi:chromosomal replication initiator DnaA [Rhodoplanes serenus]|uniref:Chromosomal replication initiator DnaA n=1 Tax=Rhodoplanes serenus TaxID=200615 RepID=A0A9X4XKX7_9BRAD|nr:helix-turn-helix domain-containing protein [Rhodoplanes serenus]MTW17093.1 chromosomal replication initiator DnaA [Rhodoplanes serenus]